MAIPGLIMAGAALANYYNTNQQNARNNKVNFNLYQQQRDDNIKMWHMQNEYNDPKAQMARLKGAGLNPHLVYGNGADATAGAIQGATPTANTAQAAQLDVTGPLNTYFDTRLKSAQTDNLRVMNTVHATEAAIKAQDLYSKNRENKVADRLVENTVAFAEESLRKAEIENNNAIESNNRANEMHGMNLQNALEQQLNSKSGRELQDQQRENLKADLQDKEVQILLRQLEYSLRKQGINPNGPMWERVLGNIINQATNGKSIYKVIKEMLF